MDGLEELLGLATGLTKIVLSASRYDVGGVRFRTRDLPWGWSGQVTGSSPWLDLQGPYGARLFVTAETSEVMEESKRCQEMLLGCHFPSIVLTGRSGFAGSGEEGHRYIKWVALKSKRPGTYLTFLYQARLDREAAEADFERLRRCVEIVEMLPSPKGCSS